MKTRLLLLSVMFITLQISRVSGQTTGTTGGTLSDNLKNLNLWGTQSDTIQRIYKTAYDFLQARTEASFADLAVDSTFSQLCSLNEISHLGGPMLGNIGSNGASVWVRTSKPAKVEVKTLINDKESIFGPVASTSETDLTAIIPVTGLSPSTRYPYGILIDGKPMVTPSHAAISTLPAEQAQGIVRIAFGTCPHRWGLGNPRQADLIVSRKPAAMLLYGDMSAQDRKNHQGLARADYLLRDFYEAWRNLSCAVPVYATWDDHDYWDDDGWGIPAGYADQDRKKVWNLFRRSWNNPSYGFNDERGGVFLRARIGPCDILMTDNRYFRTANAFLGAEQMAWLEAQLLDCKGPFIILSCGTMWSDYVTGGKDSWNEHDRPGREKIFQWIEKNRIGGVLFVSGDRHGARGFRIPRPSGFNFHEFEPASLGGRSGPLATDPAWAGVQLFGISGQYAFGEFEFNTVSTDPEVTFRLIKEDGTIHYQTNFTRSQLTPPGDSLPSNISQGPRFPGKTVSFRPNPSNQTVYFSFSAGLPGSPSLLEIFDICGKRIHAATLGVCGNGVQEYVWRAQKQPPGVYLVAISNGGRTHRIKMTLKG